MSYIRTTLPAAVATAALVTPLLTQSPANADVTLLSRNLTTGVAVSAVFPEAGRSMTYSVRVRATAQQLVFNPVTRQFVLRTVPTSASNVSIYVTMPSSFTTSPFGFRAGSGFTCAGSAVIEGKFVFSCTGSIPSTGTSVAAIVDTTGGSGITTPYPFTSRVDPSNQVVESNETDNAATCNVSYDNATFGLLTGTGCERP